ncbi:MAG: helix-turn-helix transcriptional regulator [Nitrospina sp.]|jgi:DNA-binding NarL/FixJ family response regulator|nr:helix-turn-helix transcriptional regulator [Nitrospina sp.]MBT3416146.1 helix-turn-helix transcriptional regulator [Nitrospina sp.]MBT3857402.1 helix-turn-helix transcriptional regulator [Nitrospina sp.]MBT4105415.1 helix-turn-helix transcriptional regulator [Nitrospina sp.]MBT4389613.1 helix-turn-helix transcriptional regulator [Nitrospina sp.]
MTDIREANPMVLVLSGTFVVLVGLDLVSDYLEGGTGTHLILEGLLLALSGAVFGGGVRQLLQARQKIESLKSDVEKLNEEKEKWKGETHQLLAGLSVKIENQFAYWKLTPAETEVGFLLLKGFSLKEIADTRSTKLKTVQQQSQSIYQKTSLASRSELAAFFLEDLLPPA